MNLFRIGDRVKLNQSECPDDYPKGEFTVTCIEGFLIGFVSDYRDEWGYKKEWRYIRSGERPYWHYSYFHLIESVEDIPFNKQLKEITNEK